jgi:hypothetical protein
MPDNQDGFGFLVDANGNSLSAVKVPITGKASFAPYAAENIISDEDMGANPIVLPAAHKILGLFKEDGGFADGRDDGDPIKLFQQGYQLPGEGSRNVAIGLAEENSSVQALIEDKTPDEHGVIYVDSSLPDNRFVLFTLERFKNKYERRRCGIANITSVDYDQSTRGDIEGVTVTFTWVEDELLQGAPFKQWFGKPGATPIQP